MAILPSPLLRLLDITVRLTSVPLLILRSALLRVLDALVALSVLYSILHRLGAVRRLLQRWAESELGKIANGASFTVGYLEVDVVGGRVGVTDLVIHAPRRDEWMWDSPLIARFGRLDVSLNILSCIDVVGPALGFPCKDVHSVLARDVQVFVEKRRNVFNFHLLDPSLDMPDPAEVIDSLRAAGGVDGSGVGADAGGRPPPPARSASLSAVGAGAASASAADADALNAEFNRTDPNLRGHHPPLHSRSDSTEAEAKANEIVNNLVGAVSSVGRAANEGGKQGLHLALMAQKEGFVGQLKEFQAKLGGAQREEGTRRSDRASGHSPTGGGRGGGGAGGRPPLRKGESALGALAKDGAQVMRHLGKVVGKNVSDIKQQVDSFQKPPPKKEGWVDPSADEAFRFGGIVFRDVRIFTKDLIAMRTAGGGGGKATGSSMPNVLASASEQRPPSSFDLPPAASRPRRPPSAVGWSDPIHIRELAVSGAELCPPMAARDADTGLPQIGLKIDRVLDILLARLLAETAKSNTGRLLNNAFGEVFTWMELKSGAAEAQRRLAP